MSTVNAATLAVRVVVESGDAATRLREMHTLVQNVGQARIPDDLQKSISNIGNVSQSTAKSIQELAQAQQNIRVDNAANQYQNLTGKLEIARQKMTELSEKYGEGSTQAKNAALAVQTLEGKVSTANATLQLQRDKLEAIQSGTGDAASAVQLLSSQYGNAATAIAALSGKLEQQKAAVKETKTALDMLKSGADQAKPPIQNLTVEVTALANTGGRFSALTEIVTGGLRRIGSEIVSSVLPAFRDMISIGTDYQASMSMFAAVSGASADEMARASETAKALGADMDLPATSAAGAGRSMTELAKAGLSASESMAAAKGTLQLAAAGMLSEAEAAQYTSAALNAFALDGSEATRVADLLAASVSASGSSVQQTGYAVQQAAAVYASAGVPIEDMIVLINELSASGIKGSDAGTSLKTMLISLQNPSVKAAGELRNLGVSLYDAQGAMRPMRDVIGDLERATASLTQEQKDQALATIFGSDAVRAANIVVRNGTDGFDKFAEKTRAGGEAGKLAGAQMTGLGGAVAGLQSQLETAALNGIQPLLPLMESFVRKLADMAGWLGNNIGPAMEDFVNGLRLVRDGAEVVGTWITGTFIPALDTLGVMAGIAALAFAPMAISMGATAVAGAAAGISLSGVAFGLGAVAVNAAAAMAPFALLTGALWLAWEAAKAYTEYQDKITNGIDGMLKTTGFWADASSTLEQFNQVQGSASEGTRQQAAELQVLQDQLRQLTELHVDATAKKKLNAEEDADFTRRELELKAAIESKTTALNASITADRNSNQSAADSVMGLRDLREGVTSAALGVTDLTGATGLMGEALDEVNQQITNVNSKGFDIFGTMEQNYKGHTESMARLQTEYNQATDEKTKKSLQDQINDQIIAYAQQEQIQRESIGRQLMALADLEGQKAGLSQSAINEMVNGIAAEYGVMENVTGQAFGGMANSITDWADSGGKNTASVIAGLTQTSDAALATQQAVATMTGQYELRLETNLKEGKIDAETFNALMREVPSQHNLTLFQNFMDGKLSAADFIAAVNAVPPSKTTVLNVDATSGKAAAYSAGADFVAGMAAGMEANIYMVANASQKTAATAAAAARNYLQIQSPSRLMFVMGQFIPEGMAMGIEAKGGSIGDALVSVIGKGAGKGAVAAAESIGKIADTVSKAIDSLNKLNEFERPTNDSILSLTESLQSMVVAFAARVVPMKEKAQEALGNYADMVGKIVSVIGEGADALTSLVDFVPPADMAINSFMASLGALVYEFSTEAADANAELFDGATAFAETAGAAIGVIADGVAAFEALRDFAPVAEIDIKLFTLATRDLVREMIERFREIDGDMLEGANAFAETAGNGIGIIKDGVEAFELLREFSAMPMLPIQLFTLAVRDLVRELIERTTEVNIDMLDAANQFTTTAGNAIGIIGDGVEGFLLLSTYQGTPQAALDLFANDLRAAVSMMVQMASEFEITGVEAAALFADSVGRILEPISAGVDAFTSLKDYEGVVPGALQTLGADLESATAMMVAMSARADIEGVEAAASFADSLGQVFGGISSGIDALSALGEYEGLSQEKLGTLQNDMQAAMGMVAALAGMSAQAAIDGATWEKNLAAFAESIRNGMNSLSGLNGLSVSVSASVSASAATGGESAPVDGSHADGLDRVPFDGYVARLHADERVLTADNARKMDSLFSILAEMTGGTSGRSTMDVNAPTSAGTPALNTQNNERPQVIVQVVGSELDLVEVAYRIKEIYDRG